MIGDIRHRQCVRLIPFQAFLGLYTQVQLQFAVNAINALMIPAKALHIPQIQKTQAKAPSSAVAPFSGM